MPTGEPFLNPYTFIPAFPRSGLPDGFEDRAPDGQERLRKGWTGRIGVTLTVETPLLVLDPSRAEGSDHKVYPVRLRDGRPYLAATSVKGMLRAAYEAITNSRFGVFTGHDRPLAFRHSPDFANKLIPVQVLADKTVQAFEQAVIKMYDKTGRGLYPKNGMPVPRHGQKVHAVISGGKGIPEVVRFVPEGRMRNLRLRGRERLVNGTFCVTGRNIDGKRYERLFFTEPGQEPKVLHPADTWDDLLAHWNALRCSAETSESWPDLAEGTLCYAYREPESTKVSRLYPVLVPRDLSPVSPAEMLDPSIAPAACLGELSPADRVFGWVAPEASGVRPAAYKGRLRIGPVICDDDADTAVRRFDGDGLPLAILGQPKPQQGRFYLAASKHRPDLPIPDRTAKGDLYRHDRGLRGRKAYWHHAGLDAKRHWDPSRRGGGDPAQELLPGNRFREYLRPHEPVDDQGTSTRDGRRYATNGQDQRDKQNRSITGWVKPGTTFRFTIDVRDLDDIELGALAWLLTLPDGHFHRLGLGRPLGFGSVRLAIDPSRTTLHSAADYVAYYRTLSGTLPETDGHKVLQSAGDMFDQIVENSPSLGAIRDAFQVVTSGDPNIPVHYPRVLGNKLSPNAPAPPDPRGRNFEWFTQNERTGQDAPKGTRRSLPAATDRSHPLVVFPEPPPEKSKGPKSGGKNGNNRRKG